MNTRSKKNPAPSQGSPSRGWADAISPERIRARAYDIYRARAVGDSLSDWIRAEREIGQALEGCCGDARTNAIATLPDRIRARAYEIYSERMADPSSDWRQAERELRGTPHQGSPSPAAETEPRNAPETPEVRVRARGEALLRSGD